MTISLLTAVEFIFAILCTLTRASLLSRALYAGVVRVTAALNALPVITGAAKLTETRDTEPLFTTPSLTLATITRAPHFTATDLTGVRRVAAQARVSAGVTRSAAGLTSSPTRVNADRALTDEATTTCAREGIGATRLSLPAAAHDRALITVSVKPFTRGRRIGFPSLAPSSRPCGTPTPFLTWALLPDMGTPS